MAATEPAFPLLAIFRLKAEATKSRVESLPPMP